MERAIARVCAVTNERLLGSYLVRVSVGSRGRHLAVHSVLTGERRVCADFAELASYLDATTADAARRGLHGEPTGAGPDEALEVTDLDDAGDAPGGHGR